MLNLSLYDEQVLNNYKSKAQITRVLSENWFDSEMYCPCCLNRKMSSFPNNKKATDFYCKNCNNTFQLKASRTNFGKKVVDGAYKAMMNYLRQNTAPNFCLMHYSADDWLIKNLIFIPKFFISTSLIEKRKPLKQSARRSGWVGCNLLLNRVSSEGKIMLVDNQDVLDPERAHQQWEKMSFLEEEKVQNRGWTSDVLACVEDLGKENFSLQEVYGYKDYLQDLHPDNKHVKAKIRQQLQVLRDNNILEFLGNGVYKKI